MRVVSGADALPAPTDGHARCKVCALRVRPALARQLQRTRERDAIRAKAWRARHVDPPLGGLVLSILVVFPKFGSFRACYAGGVAVCVSADFVTGAWRDRVSCSVYFSGFVIVPGVHGGSGALFCSGVGRSGV